MTTLDKQFDRKAVTIVTKLDSVVWVHQHGQMLSPDGKTKFEIMTKNKCLSLPMTYKLFKTKLSGALYNGEQVYDLCRVKETENQLL